MQSARRHRSALSWWRVHRTTFLELVHTHEVGHHIRQQQQDAHERYAREEEREQEQRQFYESHDELDQYAVSRLLVEGDYAEDE